MLWVVRKTDSRKRAAFEKAMSIYTSFIFCQVYCTFISYLPRSVYLTTKTSLSYIVKNKKWHRWLRWLNSHLVPFVQMLPFIFRKQHTELFVRQTKNTIHQTEIQLRVSRPATNPTTTPIKHSQIIPAPSQTVVGLQKLGCQ